MGFATSLRKTAGVLASSSRGTVADLFSAVRKHDAHRMAALVSEGSPLESLVDELLRVAFWALLVAPMVLVPVYYLLLTL